MEKSIKSSDYNIFTKKLGNSNVKMSTENEPETGSNGYSNFITKLKGYAKLNTNDEEANVQAENTGFIGKIKNCLKNTFEVEKSYKLFFIILSVGLGLIFLSLVFLPLVWITPQKFVSLFSLGSLVTISSFVFVYGTSAYLEMLFSKQRALFTILFLVSIFLGIYFAFNQTYYIISLICAVIQLITLIIFTLSFIPGGSMGISFITNILLAPVNSLWNKIKGSSS
jgi:hypothetical protein